MVALDQTPEDIFGKVMSWADDLILPGFEIATNVPWNEIVSIKSALTSGTNPRDLKARLAFEIVSMIHDPKVAQKASEAFEATFKKGETPTDIKELFVEHGIHLKDALVHAMIVPSNTEWRRLVEAHAVSQAGTEELITDFYMKVEKNLVLRIGKKRFVKITVK